MDSKYRGDNQQGARSPSYYCFTGQAHGAGYMNPEHWRHQHGYIQNNCAHHHHYSQSRPQDMHDAIQREIEKERIREEIIMSEIVRRRVLEAEVRRELLMEQEMASQSVSNGFPFSSSTVTWLESPSRPSRLGARAGTRDLERHLKIRKS